MSDRKKITKILSKLTEKHISPVNDPRIYWAREVTFDYASDHTIRVDYMQFKPVNSSVSGIEHGDFYCYEIKSSVEDFQSKNGHNMIGDYNYYVMPYEVYCRVKDQIPWSVGVLCPEVRQEKYWENPGDIQLPEDLWDFLVSKKKAHRANRTRPISEMLLMMFRSCRRDTRKEEMIPIDEIKC